MGLPKPILHVTIRKEVLVAYISTSRHWPDLSLSYTSARLYFFPWLLEIHCVVFSAKNIYRHLCATHYCSINFRVNLSDGMYVFEPMILLNLGVMQFVCKLRMWYEVPWKCLKGLMGLPEFWRIRGHG